MIFPLYFIHYINYPLYHFRFVTYMNDTMPIIEHFRSSGLVREMNANKTIEDVYIDVKSKCEF